MEPDTYEPTEAILALMRSYLRLRYHSTGSTMYSKSFINPNRSRWFGVFKKLYLELRRRDLDGEDYMQWAIAHDTTAHHKPNLLLSPWKFDAYLKSRKKAKATAVNDGLDYETLRGQAQADMQIALDRWMERGRFYPNYEAFVAGEYAALPALFLATDQVFLKLWEKTDQLMPAKSQDVKQWLDFLNCHRMIAKEIGEIRDRAIELAAAC